MPSSPPSGDRPMSQRGVRVAMPSSFVRATIATSQRANSAPCTTSSALLSALLTRMTADQVEIELLNIDAGISALSIIDACGTAIAEMSPTHATFVDSVKKRRPGLMRWAARRVASLVLARRQSARPPRRDCSVRPVRRARTSRSRRVAGGGRKAAGSSSGREGEPPPPVGGTPGSVIRGRQSVGAGA